MINKAIHNLQIKHTHTHNFLKLLSPQPVRIADVSIRRLNTSHKLPKGSQLADKGLVQRSAEIRRVVVCVRNRHGDTDITAEGGLSAVRGSDDEVVALGELIVQQAGRVYQSALAVNVEVVGAVVDVM